MNVTTEPADVEVFHLSVGEEQALTDQLRSFWETESLGVNMGIEQRPETDTVWKFERSVKYHQGRYDVCLPWREDHLKLATNYCTALNCLKSLESRTTKLRVCLMPLLMSDSRSLNDCILT